jgi:hypothetical protein
MKSPYLTPALTRWANFAARLRRWESSALKWEQFHEKARTSSRLPSSSSSNSKIEELFVQTWRGISMKNNHILIIASLLSILLMTLHMTSDTIHARAGTLEAGGSTLVGVPVLAIWLYGTLMLNERRLGLVIMLVGSVLTMGMPVAHAMAPGGFFQGAIARSSPAFLFVWTLHAMGVIGIFAFILSVRGLWGLRRGQPR